MKKILTSLLIIVITLLAIVNISYGAESEDIGLTLEGPSTIDGTSGKLTLTLKLGEFTGVSENIVLGYETVLDYDTSVFESVEVKGLNGWTATYSDSTKRIIGDTTSAKANTEITQLIFTLKSDVKSTTSNIKLNNLTLAVDTKTFDKSQSFDVNIQNQTSSQEDDPETSETPSTPESQQEKSSGATNGTGTTTQTTSTRNSNCREKY